MNATTNGDYAGTSTGNAGEVRDHLRAAGESAASQARARAAQAQQWARTRASQAQDWARSHIGDVQQRIEAQPYKAAALALGIGILMGVLMTMVGSSRRHD